MASTPQLEPQRVVPRQCPRYALDFSLKVFSPGTTGATPGRVVRGPGYRSE